ncbi:hypothetical protein QQX13_00250 [Demequina sp. SYSU T00068]|uniref:hypothetical protein n=1 Tax=Demequina lignilytica TaxID=3051663 RepID=UPI002628A1D5|nr:hypothetical protein [Demequina sp. SYSU T00068]MDN4489254.1 hypothetical protein [Demequina sp. SYSU T00068]
MIAQKGSDRVAILAERTHDDGKVPRVLCSLANRRFLSRDGLIDGSQGLDGSPEVEVAGCEVGQMERQVSERLRVRIDCAYRIPGERDRRLESRCPARRVAVDAVQMRTT